jgi:glyoxylase-like metal-dependent hydrolase (beta-lactamase superfamily II)
MRHRDVAELQEAKERMPIAVPECPGIYHCGFHAEHSFGATSYLITRPEGNILMDSPRFNPFLAKRFAKLGGVKHIVLSHM